MRLSAKAVVRSAIEHSRVWRLLDGHTQCLATIFTLHRVHRHGHVILDPSFWIGERFLEATVRYVIGRGHDIVTIGELHRRLAVGETTRRMVVFTFDDGYRDNLELAAPIFAGHGVPWTLYLTSGVPDRTCTYWWGALERLILDRDHIELECIAGLHLATETLEAKRAAFSTIAKIVCHADGAALAAEIMDRYGIDHRRLLEQDAMTWDDVRALAEAGVEIGAHTISHRSLASLPEAEARHEMAGSRDRIRCMAGIEPAHFSAPFGTPQTVGRRERELAIALGFKSLATTRAAGVTRDGGIDMFQLPRITLAGEPERLSRVGLHLSDAITWLSGRTTVPMRR